MLQIQTDMRNAEGIKYSLLELNEFLHSPKLLQKHLNEYTFIYPAFGKNVNGEFSEPESEMETLRHDMKNEFNNSGKNFCHQLPYITSDTLFFGKVAMNKKLHPLILKYINKVISIAKKDDLL